MTYPHESHECAPLRSRVRVKVCGFTNAQDLTAALALGIDAVGLNLAKGPRKITLDQAAELRALIPPPVSAIALFVDAKQDDIEEALDRTGCDCVQLHGNESPQLAERLMKRCRVIKAFRIRTVDDLIASNNYPCHAVLLDAYVPGIEGGSGHGWDYNLLHQHQPSRPWFLAGGIKPDTAASILRDLTTAGCSPWAIDCASGVESSPGRKDPDLIAELINQVSSLK